MSFNIEGRDRFGTPIGLCLSGLLVILVALYGAQTTYNSINVPTVNYFEKEPELTKISLESIGFEMAWGAHNADDTSSALNDLNFVEWAPYLEISEHGKQFKTVISLDFHVCTDEDYERFDTPVPEDK
jgi:hypothetical protein